MLRLTPRPRTRTRAYVSHPNFEELETDHPQDNEAAKDNEATKDTAGA
jgi:hypothetical protein